MDLEGNVCLNILREDWKPVLNLNAVMVGLQYLFLEPNPDDPLNKGQSLFLSSHTTTLEQLLTNIIKTEAAKDLRENRVRFAQNVRTSMRGGYVAEEQYANVMS